LRPQRDAAQARRRRARHRPRPHLPDRRQEDLVHPAAREGRSLEDAPATCIGRAPDRADQAGRRREGPAATGRDRRDHAVDAERVAAFEQPALGLTDHGVMNGAVELYKACTKRGVKPILGFEAYLCDDLGSDAVRYERNHLTLLAGSDAGLRNLVKLTSAGFL